MTAVDRADIARLRATLIGGSAAVLWASLALLTTLTGGVPPTALNPEVLGR